MDLAEKPASLGELRRFAQRFGITPLINSDSGRFQELGLRHARMSDESWLAKLAEEPLLLKMPLVRNSAQVSIGLDESTWKKWTQK